MLLAKEGCHKWLLDKAQLHIWDGFAVVTASRNAMLLCQVPI